MRRLACAVGVVCLIAGAAGRVAAQEAPPPAWLTNPLPERRAPRAAVRTPRHAGASYLGPVGGVRVVDAGSGEVGTVRLQLLADFFRTSDYLYRSDDVRYVGSALALGYTPLPHLELAFALTMRQLHDRDAQAGQKSTLASTGNPYFDVKVHGVLARGVRLGGDASLTVHSAQLEDGFAYGGTSLGLRGNLSLDLRDMRSHVPLLVRFNLGYVFDQSRKLAQDAERDRFARLSAAGKTAYSTRADEVRQLATRDERLAYGIQRVDSTNLALGLEAPLAISPNAALHPILEWDLQIPVNRQGYDCSRASEPAGNWAQGADGCLDRGGAKSWPQRITVGARLYPALHGLSLLAAVIIGVTGRSDFVRELPPTEPWRLVFAGSYEFGVSQ